ncbi:MAG: hypothetical protein JWL84_4168 [Rhodospirillales bacterium]|nr:hypothetical protein [Rhodospirillales bacterium]
MVPADDAPQFSRQRRQVANLPLEIANVLAGNGIHVTSVLAPLVGEVQ